MFLFIVVHVSFNVAFSITRLRDALVTSQDNVTGSEVPLRPATNVTLIILFINLHRFGSVIKKNCIIRQQTEGLFICMRVTSVILLTCTSFNYLVTSTNPEYSFREATENKPMKTSLLSSLRLLVNVLCMQNRVRSGRLLHSLL